MTKHDPWTVHEARLVLGAMTGIFRLRSRKNERERAWELIWTLGGSQAALTMLQGCQRWLQEEHLATHSACLTLLLGETTQHQIQQCLRCGRTHAMTVLNRLCELIAIYANQQHHQPRPQSIIRVINSARRPARVVPERRRRQAVRP